MHTAARYLIPLSALIALPVSSARAESLRIEMGDGKIDGRAIAPYEFAWRQCARQGDTWTDGGTVVERATVLREDDQPFLRIEQETRMPDGTRVVAVTRFDRATLAPLLVATDIRGADGQSVGTGRYELSLDGYSGQRQVGDKTQAMEGPVSSREYHGVYLGLALATLELSDGMSIELPASMLSVNGTYDTVATVNGTASMNLGDRQVDAWLVDVEWRHLGADAVYPGGPDASGGRYWIVTDPPSGVPYVVRYKTDTYAIEFVPTVCPGAGTPDS